MASRIKTMKSLLRLLDTWLKNDEEKGNEIIMIMREHGLLTKTGRVSRSKKIYKKNKSGVSEFELARNEIENKYGYYSKYKEKMKQSFKNARENNRTSAKSWKEYSAQLKKYSELIEALFENFPSEGAYEEYQYCESLDMETAIERLSEEIAQHRIFSAEEYRAEYGDFTAPNF